MKKLIIAVLIIFCIIVAKAQSTLSLDYTTEAQTNFGKKYNWVNLLSLSAGLSSEKISEHWVNGFFRADFISVYKIHKERISNDIMTFSNIEENNLPINPYVLGYTQRWGKMALFGGVRNVNNDYYITPYTSLFTNSSAGIFPTISLNFPLANYPLSAVCLHFEYQPTVKLLFKTSLYNGVAHDPRKNILNSFTVNPKRDGIFSISELSYAQNKFGSGIYSLGFTLQSSNATMYSRLSQNTSRIPTYTAWLAIEHSVYRSGEKEIGSIIHVGIAPQHAVHCRHYYALGGYASGLFGRRDKLGIYLNATNVAGIKERTMEITWQFQLIDAIAIQPVYDYICTGNKITSIGIVRVMYSFNR
jgi:hypothetical protein